jgi:hypothetical protein
MVGNNRFFVSTLLALGLSVTGAGLLCSSAAPDNDLGLEAFTENTTQNANQDKKKVHLVFEPMDVLKESYEGRTEFLNYEVPLQDLVDGFITANNPEKIEKRIIISKSERVLGVYINNELLKEYGISLGTDPVGDKIRQGDRRTPEGEFYVSAKLGLGQTKFHKALLINYPNIEDAERGLETGLINQSQYNSIVRANNNCERPLHNTTLGGLIEIHGMGGGPGHSDWTHGCAAIRNSDMDEIYDFSREGCEARVTIHH